MLAPLAVMVVVVPIQMAGDDGLKVKVDAVLTVTVTVCVFTQPLLFVPLTE